MGRDGVPVSRWASVQKSPQEMETGSRVFIARGYRGNRLIHPQQQRSVPSFLLFVPDNLAQQLRSWWPAAGLTWRLGLVLMLEAWVDRGHASARKTVPRPGARGAIKGMIRRPMCGSPKLHEARSTAPRPAGWTRHRANRQGRLPAQEPLDWFGFHLKFLVLEIVGGGFVELVVKPISP